MSPSKSDLPSLLEPKCCQESTIDPEHHAPQVIGANGLTPEKEFNDDGFVDPVKLARNC